MIVVDASAMVEALVGRAPDPRLFELLGGDLHAPHLIDVEVTSVLRGLSLGGRVGIDTSENARLDLAGLDVVRHEFAPFADRVWALRHQFTSYDASYLALAEALDAPLVTCDAKLATTGHRAQILLMTGSRRTVEPLRPEQDPVEARMVRASTKRGSPRTVSWCPTSPLP